MRDKDEYEATSAIIRGVRPFPSAFAPLAQWIEATYATDVVNIVEDALSSGRPRLVIWLRTKQQSDSFHVGANFDRAKQHAVAAHARQSGALVVFRDFETLARERAIALPPDTVDQLRLRLSDPALQAIRIAWTRVVFFVRTDGEAARFAEGPEFQRWSAQFLVEARANDEFGVLSEMPPSFGLDSEERFHRDFAGSWYNYFR